MECKKCDLHLEPGSERYTVELCPLHAAAGELLKAAKVIQDTFFVRKEHISAVLMVSLVEAIAKAEGKSPA